MDRQARFDAVPEDNRFEELHQKRQLRRIEYEKETSSGEFRGTCVDMCPEYERHERELHLDLNIFEMARNEQPLPEDVRPPKVLESTLMYICNEIIDREDYHFSEIHKFIRDRTRGIRQDFTLQNIRDETCVALHEKIARFHIFSGHRLCQEDKTTFDDFQNTEQLRKVLQSLHEYYSDAYRNNQDPTQYKYENEPEFRCYYILTHLKDENVFRNSVNFHPLVFANDQVQFALECCTAYRENNYVRFFDLVRNATYLSGCLLFQHFKSMRIKALSVMNKVYGGTFSVKDLVTVLAFEDQAEAIDFCNVVGLTLKNDEFVQFNKELDINDVSSTYKVRRANALIESKNTLKNSELVLGMAPIYKKEDEQKEYQRKKERIINEISQEITKNLVESMLQQETRNAATLVINAFYEQQVSQRNNFIQGFSSMYLQKFFDEEVNNLVKELIFDQFKLIQKLKRDAFIEEYSKRFFEERILQAVVYFFSKNCTYEMAAKSLEEKNVLKNHLTKWRVIFKAFVKWKKIIQYANERREKRIENISNISLVPNEFKIDKIIEQGRNKRLKQVDADQLAYSLEQFSFQRKKVYQRIELENIIHPISIFQSEPFKYIHLSLILPEQDSWKIEWIKSKFIPFDKIDIRKNGFTWKKKLTENFIYYVDCCFKPKERKSNYTNYIIRVIEEGNNDEISIQRALNEENEAESPVLFIILKSEDRRHAKYQVPRNLKVLIFNVEEKMSNLEKWNRCLESFFRSDNKQPRKIQVLNTSKTELLFDESILFNQILQEKLAQPFIWLEKQIHAQIFSLFLKFCNRLVILIQKMKAISQSHYSKLHFIFGDINFKASDHLLLNDQLSCSSNEKLLKYYISISSYSFSSSYLMYLQKSILNHPSLAKDIKVIFDSENYLELLLYLFDLLKSKFHYEENFLFTDEEFLVFYWNPLQESIHLFLSGIASIVSKEGNSNHHKRRNRNPSPLKTVKSPNEDFNHLIDCIRSESNDAQSFTNYLQNVLKNE